MRVTPSGFLRDPDGDGRTHHPRRSPTTTPVAAKRPGMGDVGGGGLVGDDQHDRLVIRLARLVDLAHLVDGDARLAQQVATLASAPGLSSSVMRR
jgi:hypothetical protein